MKFCFLLIFIFLKVSCIGQTNSNYYFKTVNQIVVVIQNKTDNPILLSTDKGYINIATNKKIINKKIDTLNINSNNFTYFYFSHKNSYIDTVFAGPGDTIKLIAKNNSIETTVLSKTDKNKIIANYFKKISKTTLSHKIDSLTMIFYGTDIRLKPLEIYNEFSKLLIYPLMVNKKAVVENVLDLSTLLSYLEQDYKNNKVTVADKRINSMNDLVTVINNKLQIDYFRKLSQLEMISKSANIKNKMFSNIFINNELLTSPYSNDIMMGYLLKYIIKQKPDFSRSKEHIDYKEGYDNVAICLKNDSLVKYAKFLCIEKMAEYQESINEIDKRFKNLINLYQDKKLNNLLSNQLSPILNVYQQKTNDLVLIDVVGKTHSLNSIIKNASGKLIYIDFWASWCAPCREAMPDSKRLNAEYEKKNVMFLYLSIDRDKQEWKTAVTAEGIAKHKSYLILNQQSSSLLKQIKMKEIPRYILFNKKGELIDPNAPGPRGESIVKVFNKFLKQ